MTAEYKIHVPVLHALPQKQPFRDMTHKYLHSVCILKIFHKSLLASILPVARKNVTINSSDPNLLTGDYSVYIFLFQHDSARIFQFLFQHSAIFLIFHIIQFMIPERIIDWRYLGRLFYKICYNICSVFISIQHISCHKN